MNLSVEDLKLLMTWIERRGANNANVRICMDLNEVRFTAYDNDGRVVEISLWDADTRNMPKLRASELLKVSLNSKN